MEKATPRIAVLVPCYNEAASVADVVDAFRASLPGASIHVCDNNSDDGTAALAEAAGARVSRQPLQGKGHVVRKMFADIDADVYVLVDGDSTYDAASAPAMVAMLLEDDLDMVNGRRIEKSQAAYRSGHRLGNMVFSKLVATLFGDRISDLFSGYRVLSRRFVKSFPVTSVGFQIETEMTVHALHLFMPVGEIDTGYAERVEGSPSKLDTYRDGARILWMVAKLMLDLRPMRTLGVGAIGTMASSWMLAIPVAITWAETGLVPRLPTAVFSVGLASFSFILACTGLCLRGVARARREVKQMAYLTIPPFRSA